MAVLHGGGVVPALHLDKARLLDGSLIVALLHVGVLEDVVGELLMELGRTLLHSLLHVQHEGQLLIFHLQGADALHGGHLILGDDHRHIVAPIAHMAVQQVAVRHVLMAGIHGPGMARRGEGDIRHVKAGQHLHHAVDGLGGGGIHRLDEAVGDLRVLDADVQGVLGHLILIVFRPACRLVIGVHTDLASSDFTHMVFLLDI